MLVRGLLARGQMEQAETELTSLVSRYPNSAPVHVQLGILSGLRKKDISTARRHFEHALELEPRSQEAFGGLVAMDLTEHRFDAARARLEARLESDPKNAFVLMTAARAYAGMGDGAQAEAFFRRVIETEPSYLPAYGALAQLYVSQKRLDAALAEYEEIARRGTKSAGPLTFAGIILEGQGKTAEAQDRYERALEVDPTAPVAANNLAWLLASSGGSLNVALQHAQTAYSKLPEAPEIADTLGVVLFKKDRLKESIDVLKTAIAKRPESAAYQFHLGRAYAKSGDTQLARRHLARALDLQRNFPDASEAQALLGGLPAQ